MTREEAIEFIHDIQTDAVYSILPEEKEALDMAISALSAEGEYIKKEDILACQTTFTDEAGYEYKVIEVEEVEELPTYSFPNSADDNTMEWISAKVGKLFPSNDYKCSKCGNILNFGGVNCGRGDANFCPNCGRKAVNK